MSRRADGGEGAMIERPRYMVGEAVRVVAARRLRGVVFPGFPLLPRSLQLASYQGAQGYVWAGEKKTVHGDRRWEYKVAVMVPASRVAPFVPSEAEDEVEIRRMLPEPARVVLQWIWDEDLEPDPEPSMTWEDVYIGVDLGEEPAPAGAAVGAAVEGASTVCFDCAAIVPVENTWVSKKTGIALCEGCFRKREAKGRARRGQHTREGG